MHVEFICVDGVFTHLLAQNVHSNDVFDENKIIIYILSKMSSTSCVKSAWKQQLNSCITDYCRGWTTTHLLSCFAQELPLHHVMMTSDNKSPLISQFSLTFQRGFFFASLCRPHTGRWGHGALCAHRRGIHRCAWEITAGCSELRALAFHPTSTHPTES